jgi:hypothetical protein
LTLGGDTGDALSLELPNVDVKALQLVVTEAGLELLADSKGP